MMNMQVYRYIFKKVFGHPYSVSSSDDRFSSADYQALVALSYIMQRQGHQLKDFSYNMQNGALVSDEVFESMKKSLSIPESYVILYPNFKHFVKTLKNCAENSSKRLETIEEKVIAAAKYDFYVNYLEKEIYIPTVERYRNYTDLEKAHEEFKAGENFWAEFENKLNENVELEA